MRSDIEQMGIVNNGCSIFINGGVGSGKTTFALQLAKRISSKSKRTLYISTQETMDAITKSFKKNNIDFSDARSKQLIGENLWVFCGSRITTEMLGNIKNGFFHNVIIDDGFDTNIFVGDSKVNLEKETNGVFVFASVSCCDSVKNSGVTRIQIVNNSGRVVGKIQCSHNTHYIGIIDLHEPDQEPKPEKNCKIRSILINQMLVINQMLASKIQDGSVNKEDVALHHWMILLTLDLAESIKERLGE